MSAPRPRLAAAALESLARDILAAAGTPPADAAIWAETLVWANLRGVDSHGVMRIPRYLDWIDQGVIRPRAAMRCATYSSSCPLLS